MPSASQPVGFRAGLRTCRRGGACRFRPDAFPCRAQWRYVWPCPAYRCGGSAGMADAGVPAVRGTGFPFQPAGHAGRSPESARILCHCRQRCRNGRSRPRARPGSPGKPRSPGKRSAPGKCRAPQRASTPPSAHSPAALALTRATRRMYLLHPDRKQRVACHQRCRNRRSPPVARVSAAHPGGAGHCSAHPHCPALIPRVRWRLPGLRVVCTCFVRTASGESLAASIVGMGVRPP